MVKNSGEKMSDDIKTLRENSLGFLVNTLAREIDCTMKQRLKKCGVDFKVFVYLMTLLERDGVHQTDLSKKLRLPEYATSRAIDGLVASGFVERKIDPDNRRSCQIFLTQAGRDRAEMLPNVVQTVNQSHLDVLSKSDRDTLITLLKKLALGPGSSCGSSC